MATFKQVEEVPDIQRDGKTVGILNDFMESGLSAAILEGEDKAGKNGETKSDVTPGTAQSLRKTAKSRGLPVSVGTREGNIYLQRTDSVSAEA